MGQVIAIKSKAKATKILEKHHELVDQNDLRQTVQNALRKLNDVNGRIDRIENKGFFKRMVGGITGSNQKEMITAMRDISDAQNMTIELMLSLAIMHSQNQGALDDILDELDQSKGTYTRITDHIEFLYNQVNAVKSSQKKTTLVFLKTKTVAKYALVGIGALLVFFIIVGLIV